MKNKDKDKELTRLAETVERQHQQLLEYTADEKRLTKLSVDQQTEITSLTLVNQTILQSLYDCQQSRTRVIQRLAQVTRTNQDITDFV